MAPLQASHTARPRPRTSHVTPSTSTLRPRPTHISTFFKSKIIHDEPDSSRKFGTSQRLATEPGRDHRLTEDSCQQTRSPCAPDVSSELPAAKPTGARLAILGKDWSTPRPAGQASPSSCFSSHYLHVNRFNRGQNRSLSPREKKEEREWLERAQALSTKSKVDTNSHQIEIHCQASLAVTGLCTPSRSKSQKTNSSDDTEDSDFEMFETPKRISENFDWSTSSRATTPLSEKAGRRSQDCKSPQPPSQQTPFLHQSLSEFSMMPWELEAQRKAPEYRISAGLKPTAQDIQARQQVERRSAEQVRRDAIARSFGNPAKKGSPLAGTHAAGVPVQELPPRNRTTTTRIAAIISDVSLRKRTTARGFSPRRGVPLTPRTVPNTITPAKSACGLRLGNISGGPYDENDAQCRNLRELELLPWRVHDADSPQTAQASMSGYYPKAALVALRSQRSGHKVCALEIQMNEALSQSARKSKSRFAADERSPSSPSASYCTAAHVPTLSPSQQNGEQGSRLRLPSDPAKRPAVLNSFGGSSPLTSESGKEQDRGGPGVVAASTPLSHLSPYETSSQSSSTSCSSNFAANQRDETYQDPSRPAFLTAAPINGSLQPPRSVKKAQAAGSGSRTCDDLIGPLNDQNDAASHVRSFGRSSSTPETQPLDSDYDGDVNDTILETQVRHASSAADDSNKTQPLASPSNDPLQPREACADVADATLLLTERTAKSQLTARTEINEAWDGIRDVRLRGSERQSRLVSYGFSEARLVRTLPISHGAATTVAVEPTRTGRQSWTDHPLSRDLQEDLSESESEFVREAAGSRRLSSDSRFVDAARALLDSQATQPLLWSPSQTDSSHTEDEEHGRDPRRPHLGFSSTTADCSMMSSSSESWLPEPSPRTSRSTAGQEMESFWRRL